MHPILFELPGGFPIRSFGVMLAAGFLLGSWIFNRLIARYGDDPEADVARYGAIPMWVLIGVVVGARMLYVIVEIAKGSAVGDQYLDAPWTVFAVWEGGLVMYGGFFGGAIGGAWCAAKHGLNVRHAMDIGMVAAFFGQAVGRVGCLLVGDDYGARVPEGSRDLPFPITLRVPDPLPEHSLFGPENAGQVLWATQPWMSAKALIVAAAALFVLRRRRYAGQVTLVAALVYSVLRFGVEMFRGDEVRGVWFDGAISTSQLISVVVVLASASLLWRFRARTETIRT